MKRYLGIFLLMLSTLMLIAPNADARRLGGGGSFGRQSSRIAPPPAPMRQAQPMPQPAPRYAPGGYAPAPQTPPQYANRSGMGGMLGGALLGLGLGSMLGHGAASGMPMEGGGGGGGFLTIIIVGAIAWLLYQRFRR